MDESASTTSRADSAWEAIQEHRPGAVVPMAGSRCATSRSQLASADYDVLAETLRAIRLTGSVFLNARFSKPFGVVSPDQFDARAPLAHLRHVSIFHLLASGSCTIEIANGERRTVSEGDILLLPFAAAHKLWNGDCREMAFAPDLMRPGPVEGLWTLNHGGGGEVTRMVCGFIESSEFLYTQVFRSLPPLLVERTSDDRISAVITSTVREILALADAATQGTELMLGRLMELLFVEVVRRYASRLPGTAKGWFAALGDPVVGRALELMHRDGARRWTVSELAREAGTSRSVLSERFSAIVGQPPIEYLAGWRMQLAVERLRNSDDRLAAVAAEIGYESEASFNRAFKRMTGLTPGRWRDVEAAHRSGTSRTRGDDDQSTCCGESVPPTAPLRGAGTPGMSLNASIRTTRRGSQPSVPCPSCRARPRM